VTPSFNQGATIRQTIESVLAQDYAPIEYIIMDGGSTDGTLDVIREYEHDPRLQWHSGPDGGQADAIQKGFVRGSGEVLAWLNSDDFYLPGAVSTAVTAMQQRGSRFVFGDALLVDEQSRFERYFVHPAFSPRQFRMRYGIYQPACFWTRDLYEQAGGIDASLQFAMDRDLFWRMSQVEPPAHIRSFLCAARIYRATKTARLFGTLGRQEVMAVERRIGGSLPLYFARYLPGFPEYPRWLQLILRAAFSLYNTPLRFFYTPSYMARKVALGAYWTLRSLPLRGRPVSPQQGIAH
jgi:glycosyltransferase involved in cell wall biosynthesis